MPGSGVSGPEIRNLSLFEIHNKELSKTHGISIGDFPDVTKMQEQLREADFSKFKAIHKSTLEKVRPFSLTMTHSL